MLNVIPRADPGSSHVYRNTNNNGSARKLGTFRFLTAILVSYLFPLETSTRFQPWILFALWMSASPPGSHDQRRPARKTRLQNLHNKSQPRPLKALISLAETHEFDSFNSLNPFGVTNTAAENFSGPARAPLARDTVPLFSLAEKNLD
jgi:hypothetical protein